MRREAAYSLGGLTGQNWRFDDPELIKKGANIESSKLSMFVEIINELIENRHKVLVFSQFTGHLAIIRETCDKIGIHYQYLDGSTPIKERQKRIDAFQSGQPTLRIHRPFGR